MQTKYGTLVLEEGPFQVFEEIVMAAFTTGLEQRKYYWGLKDKGVFFGPQTSILNCCKDYENFNAELFFLEAEFPDNVIRVDFKRKQRIK